MSLTVDITKNLSSKKSGDFSLNISFETDGGVSGLLGASGSGKSMSLMCIAGIVKPDRGRIILNGRTLFDSERRINLTPQKRRVGYLFQNYALFPDMTARQNIMCGLHNEKDKTRKEESFQEIIELMQLMGLENHRPDQLSGGQKQRVALARILVGNPDLLMLDEPFSALDGHLRSHLQVETQKLLKRLGKEALLVTHDRNEAYQLCHKIALLDSGRVLVHKDKENLFADPESRQAAVLTGCKNVVGAEKAGEYQVHVPPWGVRFTTSQPVRDGLCAIGIRAHYFDPDAVQNRFPICFADEIEAPFEYFGQFRYENQLDESQNIWWSIPKGQKTAQWPSEIGVDPVNIMLLYNSSRTL
ncbi:MAG: ATP-binding cassette domain-containing protein [Peptococcaceae bacterium]|nr:ATP-binding cassette domain-containing protein [Peptococcaceae bacterium]